MALDIRWEYIVGILLIGIPLLLIILEIIDKRIIKNSEKIKKKKEIKKRVYLKKIRNVDASKGEKALEKINKIAKKFFKEYYGIKGFQGYYALERYFKRIDKTAEAEFCKKMNEHMYSGYTHLNGNKINEKNQELKKDFEVLIVSAPLLDLTKKKKLSNIIKIFGINKKKLKNKDDKSKNQKVQ